MAVQIQHYIQEGGSWPGGHFLGREEDLAAEFGVSRPTLREALRLLASGNLIRATKGPGGGIFVARTAEEGMSRSLSDAIAMMLETGTVTLDELLDARLLLEVPLAGLAAYQPDELTLTRLREVVAREAAAGPNDTETYAECDMEIHRTLADAAGNRMIRSADRLDLRGAPAVADRGAPAGDRPVRDPRAPQALLAAVERGDPVRAERTMKDHLLYLQDVLRMVRERSGGSA